MLNQRELEICNIYPQWDKYKGKGIRVAQVESTFEGEEAFLIHSKKVNYVLKSLIPEARIEILKYTVANLKRIANGEYDIVCMTTGGLLTVDINNHLKSIFDRNILNCVSTGNGKPNLDMTRMSASQYTIAVGAAHIFPSGEIDRAYYSSYGYAIDCVGLSYLQSPYGLLQGTSFSCPLVVGMLVKYMEYYREKIGVFPTIQHIKELIRNSSVDINEPGFDRYVGHGLFTLPNIDTSRLTKEITLKIDDKNYKVNGWIKSMDVAPFIQDSRTFVPVRFIAEELGFDVQWDDLNWEVTITGQNRIIKLKINSNIVTVNGIKKQIDVCPFIKDSRTFVPLRFISEELGCEVEWHAIKWQVLIRKLV